MLHSIIPLISAWLPIFSNYLIYYLAGGVIVIVGCFIHRLLLR